MNWPAIGHWLFDHLSTMLKGIGLTGSGIGIIKLARYWPPPKSTNKTLCVLFDTFEDLFSNHDRIGQRSDQHGTLNGTAGEPLVVLKEEK